MSWRSFHLTSSIGESDSAVSDYEQLPPYKCYQRFRHFPLVSTGDERADFNQLVAQRRSSRIFDRLASFATLSHILVDSLKERGDGSRIYPSAGGCYPTEAYLLLPYDLEPLPRGRYHFCHFTSSLEFLGEECPSAEVAAALRPTFDLANAIVVVITAIMARSEQKYGARAYRYALLEAGHICQALYMATASAYGRCCAIGGFIDREVESILYLRSDFEVPLYAAAIGQ